jgi:tRNA (cytidine/uridine-2'-O-)-methyltransferase
MRGRTLATREDLHVVLVSPEIPWNTGNVGRTCLAAGAQLHLVEPLGFSLAARPVRRAGLDYWPRVEPRTWPDWDTFEKSLPELGEPLFFSADAERTLWEAPLAPRSVLVFGRESTGLPQTLRARWRERLVGFPMADPELRSLNLSTSVALAVYEVLRRRAS